MGAIFISYTGRDPEGDAWADLLVAWCEEWNYGCFRDRDHSCGIKAGDDWRAELYQQLRLAQVLVCLVSRSYESSAWCVGEVAIAVEKGKTVIPIHLLDAPEELRTQSLPLLLQDRQAITVAPCRPPQPRAAGGGEAAAAPQPGAGAQLAAAAAVGRQPAAPPFQRQVGETVSPSGLRSRPAPMQGVLEQSSPASPPANLAGCGGA